MGDKIEPNLTIIGTNHFQPKEEIEKIIEKNNPDIVLVELCNGRITLLEHPELAAQQKGFSLLSLISKTIKNKAKEGNKEYGSDMNSAYRFSKLKKIPVGLIDRPIVETNVLMKAIPWKEKWILLKEARKLKKTNLDKVVEEAENMDVDYLLKELKTKVPNLHYFLIISREEYMVAKIKSYLYDHPGKKILCFVGKGHEEELKKRLNLIEKKGGDE